MNHLTAHDIADLRRIADTLKFDAQRVVHLLIDAYEDNAHLQDRVYELEKQVEELDVQADRAADYRGAISDALNDIRPLLKQKETPAKLGEIAHGLSSAL